MAASCRLISSTDASPGSQMRRPAATRAFFFGAIAMQQGANGIHFAGKTL
jgi:hypothetical protein